MNRTVPIFQWRVYLKGVGYRYFAFEAEAREPLRPEQFRLVQRDGNRAEPSSVGIYTRGQFEARVSAIVERTDCEVL